MADRYLNSASTTSARWSRSATTTASAPWAVSDFSKGGFIKGRFAQLSHALLYRRHQLSLHGPGRAALLWLAESINALVQPSIRMS
jgi:hypothetical protein